jgi:uncharacterized protein
LFFTFAEKIIMEAPFIFGKIAESYHFTDRESDAKKLKVNLLSGVNTMLISPRRWGKSSLVNRVAGQLKSEYKDVRFCFIDLFNVRSEMEFYEDFATKLITVTSTRWEDWVKNSKKFFLSLIPRFSVGVDPMNDFKISFDWKELKKSQNEILELPQSIASAKNIHIVVCIDEFQNITHFEESLQFQKKLRSVWQNHQSVAYCLYGSKRHMLTEIFENKSMPFYKFGEVLFLKKIDEAHWIEYIVNQFKKTEKIISEDLASKIAQLMENHPYFVQMLAKNVWQNTQKTCDKNIIQSTLDELIEQHSLIFQRELDNMTNKQVNFLKALAEGVSQFSAKDTLADYDLGAQSNISRIKTALENREIIDLWGGHIEFIDPLLRQWFKRVYHR